MKNETVIEINMETHIKKLLALLDIKFALLDYKEHIQINDYEIGTHLSVFLQDDIQVNILIDEDVQNIYFSTVLEMASCIADLDGFLTKCRVPAFFIKRSDTELQIFRSIKLSEKVDVKSVVDELSLMGRLACALINKFPGKLYAGSLYEGNFHEFGNVNCVKSMQTC